MIAAVTHRVAASSQQAVAAPAGDEPLTQSSHRLVTLDALRGVAALSIVVCHIRPPFNPDRWMSHAYLAVDLFFLLSGFVLDKSYAARLRERKLTARKFLLIRLIRLYPLLFLGAILCVITQIFANRLGVNYFDEDHFFRSAASIFSTLPLNWQSGGFLFDLNTPVWSLFFEGILSISFAFLALARLRALMAIVALSALLFALSIAYYESASVGPQWSDMLGGFPRAFFSFYLGVLMSRRFAAAPELPSFVAWLVPGLLLAVLAVSPGDRHAPAWDALCVFLLWPALLIVSIKVEPRNFGRIFSFIGLLSYGIYVIHYPIRRVVENSILGLLGNLSPATYMFITALMIAVIIISSWLILVLYDQPLRAYLSHKVVGPASPQPRPPLPAQARSSLGSDA